LEFFFILLVNYLLTSFVARFLARERVTKVIVYYPTPFF